MLVGDAGAVRELTDPDSEVAPCALSWAHILDSDFDAGETAARAGADFPARAAGLLAATMAGRAEPGALELLTDEALSLSPADLGEWDVWGGCLLGEAGMSAGRLELAETIARHTLSLSKPEDDTLIFAGQTLGRALLFQGRLDESTQVLSATERQQGYPTIGVLALVVNAAGAYIAALVDDRASVDRRADDIEGAVGCPDSYVTRGAFVLVAYALAAAGRGERAARVLLQHAGGPELSALQTVDRVYGYELLIAAALSVGDLRNARSWLELAERVPDPSPMAGAALARSAARVAVAEGRHRDSADEAARAAELADGRAGHLDATRARLLSASALLMDGDSEQAQRRLIDAGVQATRMGAISLTLLARRDLRSIGLRFAGAEQTPMSEREREVAELVIAGLSDAEIARELSLSQRTVHGHVGAVLRALGVPSRASLARSLGASRTGDQRALTGRQRQVAELVSRGFTNDGIARELGVSVKTVEKHIGDAYQRLGVRSRAALAAAVLD